VAPVLTVFERSPDRGRGLARDMRVRWALEEAGAAYEVRTVSFPAMKAQAYRNLQPFGQIPVYEEDGLVLFESGAIVLHVAERFGGLLPEDPHARARAIAWMFAALNTVEPPIVERQMAWLFEREENWYADRQQFLDARVRDRLAALAERLGDADWLDGSFSAGDILMVTVLERLAGAGPVTEFPNLVAYVARGEARPAYARAFDAQRTLFERNSRPG
jgi:glutathione S-transferase